MPEVRFPGATWLPGTAAGYQLTYEAPDGRTTMQAVKLHYTVGIDSTPIGLRGYFQFLLPKVDPPIQFAEVDAYCMDSGEGNKYGPGIEFERLDDSEPLTADQLHWGGKLIHWIHTEWSIPLTFLDDPKAASFPLSGFVTHRSLPAPNDHVDYISQADWDTMTHSKRKDDMIFRATSTSGSVGAGTCWLDATTRFIEINPVILDALGAPVLDIDGPTISAMMAEKAQLLGGHSAASGLTADQVQVIVRAELDKTRLAH